MSQAAVIAIALLLEALLIVTVIAGVLGWRLRRRRTAADGGPAAGGGLREHLEAELAALDARAPAVDSPLRHRQRLLQGELRALDLADPAAREAHFESLYAGNEEGESKRLRRLLRREARRVGELLEIRDGLRELRLGYQRLQRLLEKLTDPELEEAERREVADTFRSQASEWSAPLERLLEQLDGATRDLDTADGETPEASGGRTDARHLADSQGEALETLRGRLAADGETDPEALRAEIEAIEQRGRELSTCLQVLQDENDYLYRQLCAARAGEPADAATEDTAGEAAAKGGERRVPRADPDELEQALAMKDREIAELRQRLDDSTESLAPDR